MRNDAAVQVLAAGGVAMLLKLLVFALVIPRLAFGALAVNFPVADVNSTTDATSYAFAAFTPAANSLLIVVAHASDYTTTGVTVSDTSGLTWTQQQEILDSSGPQASWIFTAPVGGSPSSTTITLNLAVADTATSGIMSLYEVTGHDTTTPVRQSAQRDWAAAADPAIIFSSAVLTGNLYIVGSGSKARDPLAFTAPASWTEHFDSGNATTHAAENAYRINGETGTTFTFTGASLNCSMVGVEVSVASAATAARRRVEVVQ